MTRAIMRYSVRAELSFNVTVYNEGRTWLHVYNLLPLTPLLFLLWQARQAVAATQSDVSQLADDTARAIDFTVAVWVVVVKSALFGFAGVNL